MPNLDYLLPNFDDYRVYLVLDPVGDSEPPAVLIAHLKRFVMNGERNGINDDLLRAIAHEWLQGMGLIDQQPE